MDFIYTTTSLNRAYEMSFNHAIASIIANGGKVSVDSVKIKVQKPKAVRYEKSNENLMPMYKKNVNTNLTEKYQIEFEGRGIVISGEAFKNSAQSIDLDIPLEIEINGVNKKVIIPTSFTTRRLEIFVDYELSKSINKHKIILHAPKNNGYGVKLTNYITYK